VPGGRAQQHPRLRGRVRRAQLMLQELAQERMQPEPFPGVVQCGREQGPLLQPADEIPRGLRVAERSDQVDVEAVQHRQLLECAAGHGRQRIQHLPRQITRDQAVRPVELGDEPGRV
jgi:hypothetical protein